MGSGLVRPRTAGPINVKFFEVKKCFWLKIFATFLKTFLSMFSQKFIVLDEIAIYDDAENYWAP